MDLLLSISIDFVIVGFILVMVMDFVAGLRQLWKDSQPGQKEPPTNQPEVLQMPVVDDPWSAVEETEQHCCCLTAIATPIPALISSALEVANQLDFATLPNTELRKLCGKRGIKWRNVYRMNKHLSNPEMIAVLSS